MEKFASSFALHATICGTHHIQNALCAKEIQKLKEICVRRQNLDVMCILKLWRLNYNLDAGSSSYRLIL
jgi:hypothetical protein